MKTKVRILSILLTAVLLCLSLAGCGRQLVFENLRITDKKTGIEYSYISSVYEAKSVGTDVYATWKNNGITVKYYQVEGYEPETMLVSEFGDLIYSGEDDMPDIAGFGATSAVLCDSTGTVNMAIASIVDQAEVDAIVDAFVNGTAEEYPAVTGSAYTLKFESPDYSGLYYSLVVVIYETGTYLYDRYDYRFVNIGTLLDEYIYAE